MKPSNKNPKIEKYLAEMELSLSGIPISEKCDILMEISSHIEDRIDTSSMDTDAVLNSLGSAEGVANRYRLERGFSTVHTQKRRSWFKSLLIFTGICFAFTALMIVFIIKSFTPFIEVNEDQGRVRMMGGLIDINASEGFVGMKMSTGNEMTTGNKTEKLKGNQVLSFGDVLKIEANNGRIVIQSTDELEMSYDCDVQKFSGERLDKKKLNPKPSVFNLDTGMIKGVKCTFQIPKDIALNTRLLNGNVVLEDLQQNVKIKITNGTIIFEPKDAVKFSLKSEVINGSLFNNSGLTFDKSKPYQADFMVTNGKIVIK
jgi:hypothetical protein